MRGLWRRMGQGAQCKQEKNNGGSDAGNDFGASVFLCRWRIIGLYDIRTIRMPFLILPGQVIIGDQASGFVDHIVAMRLDLFGEVGFEIVIVAHRNALLLLVSHRSGEKDAHRRAGGDTDRHLLFGAVLAEDTASLLRRHRNAREKLLLGVQLGR